MYQHQMKCNVTHSTSTFGRVFRLIVTNIDKENLKLLYIDYLTR